MSLEITRNEAYRTRLGWTSDEVVSGHTKIDSTFVDAVKQLQAALGVDADGVVGPKTYRALLASVQASLIVNPIGESVARAGRIAVLELKMLWLENVIDPPNDSAHWASSRKIIDDMIRTPIGSNWTWSPPYVQNHDNEWCGYTLARAYNRSVKLEVRKNYFPSTFRLDRFARYLPINDTLANPRPSTGPYRMIIELDGKSTAAQAVFSDGTIPRAGDILLVGVKNFGQHITLIERYDPGTGSFTTLEGNGIGMGPNGKRQEGIIRTTRYIGNAPDTSFIARRIIRIAPTDLA